MAARKKKTTPKPALAAQANAEACIDPSERTRGSKKANELNPSALHQLRAADEAYRDGCIATFAECAAIAKAYAKFDREHDVFQRTVGANDVLDDILDELRRRYKDFPDRVQHHLNLRGFA